MTGYDADKHKGGNGCRKVNKGSKTLNPGMFLAFCPHGICIGFQVMMDRESPRVPFEMLMSRFAEKPINVIYDDACHLHLYCLKREPKRFQYTRFMTDRFHQKNHIACSLGYAMDSYPDDINIASFNSQVCEQANRDL